MNENIRSEFEQDSEKNYLDEADQIFSDIQAELNTDLQRAKQLGADDALQAEFDDLLNETQEEHSNFEARVERTETPYVISPELQTILEVSRRLHKPLLIEGEPGTGKTALAYALSGHEGLPLIHCRCKSTVTGQTLLYEIDHVSRLNDAMLAQNIPDVLRTQVGKWKEHIESGGSTEDPEFLGFMGGLEKASQLLNLEKAGDIRNYIQYGELGEAIIRAARGEQVILLLDEIDKAKREMLNDLLDEIEHLNLRIRETGEELSAPKENIIIIITSNHERDLPEPFKRRCVYHYIDFPTPEHMTNIVRSHLPDVGDQLLQTAIQRFYDIRDNDQLEKPPSTSEILDWIRILIEFGVEEVGRKIPYAGLLLKSKEDLDLMGETKNVVLAQEADEFSENEKISRILELVTKENAKVIEIKKRDRFSAYPDNGIYTILAKLGIRFTTADSNAQRPFEILDKEKGVLQIDQLTLFFQALGETDNNSLYQELLTKEMINQEYVVYSGAVDILEVIDATQKYLKAKAKLENGTEATIYQLPDGQIVIEQVPTVVNEEKKNEPEVPHSTDLSKYEDDLDDDDSDISVSALAKLRSGELEFEDEEQSPTSKPFPPKPELPEVKLSEAAFTMAVPEKFQELIKGFRVVQVNLPTSINPSTNAFQRATEKDKKIYTLLLNEGINFTPPKHSNSREPSTPFKISAPGVRVLDCRVDSNETSVILSFEPETTSASHIYDLFDSAQVIDKEFVIEPQPVPFTQVKEIKDYLVTGEGIVDEENCPVYKIIPPGGEPIFVTERDLAKERREAEERAKELNAALREKKEKFEKIIPLPVRTILSGGQAIRIKGESEKTGLPSPDIYTVLANAGYDFTTGKGEKPRPSSPFGSRPPASRSEFYETEFAINADGVQTIVVDGKYPTLVLTRPSENQDHPIYRLLKDHQLVEAEYKLGEGNVSLVTVDESNDYFIRGTANIDGVTCPVFKMKEDENFVYLVEQEPQELES